MKWGVLFFVLLAAACSSLSPHRNPAQSYEESQESVFKAQIPLAVVKQALEELPKKTKFIERIYRVDMDPATRILAVGARIRYPLKNLFNFQLPAGTDISDTHDLDVEVAFPSSNSLTQSGYLRLKFVKFNIDGKSYLNHFQLVLEAAQTVLANTDLVHYLSAKAPAVDKSGRELLQEILEDNGIVAFGATKSVAFKINPGNFEALKSYSYLPDLKLWVLSPFLLKGTREVFFRLEAGLGKPSNEWRQAFNQRESLDARTLQEEREDAYKRYSNVHNIKSAVNGYLNGLLAREQIKEESLSPLLRRELTSFRSSLTADARDVLSLSNESFKANPENEYLQYLERGKSRIRNFIVDLERKLSIEQQLASGADASSKGRPFLVKKISQDMLAAGMNFLKDGTSWIKESTVAPAPHMPGLILRGKIHLPLDELLDSETQGLIGDAQDLQLREVATGIPFEMAAETVMQDDGWLGLDLKSIKLFDGERALSFNRHDANDKFFIDLLKVAVVQSLAGLELEPGGDSGLSEEEERKRELAALKRYLEDLKEKYSASGGRRPSEKIIQAINVDVAKNPFSSAGERYIENKKKILFGRLFRYDPQDKLFKIQLDPRIVADKIGGAKNDIQVWGASPVYIPEHNNVFFELSLGKGKRSATYVKSLRERANSPENAGFTGLRGDNKRSSADMIATLNFDYLESAANEMLAEMAKENNGDYLKRLEKDEEQTHYILNSISVDVSGPRVLDLDLKATVISKKYKGFLFWKDWKIEKESYGIEAKVSLSAKDLNEILPYLKDHPDRVYFSYQALALKIHKARLKFGKTSLVNRALNAMAKLNLDGALGSRVRSFVLGMVNKHFLKGYQTEAAVLGNKMDRFARVLATGEEIILLLNPRMSGAAFELKLASDGDFVKEALVFDQTKQELDILLTGSPGMAKTDKKELLKIASESEVLFGKVLDLGKWPLYHELIKPSFISKAVFDNDEGKKSLYNRLLDTLRHYDQVLNAVDIPHACANCRKRFSASGSELMYFAGAAFALYDQIDQLTLKIRDYGFEEHVYRYDLLLEAKTKLLNNIIIPLNDLYQKDFHLRNQKVKEGKASYWKMSFYPDALFAEELYQVLLEEGL